MEYFHQRQGTVVGSNHSAVSVEFYYNDVKAEAIVIKEVLYYGQKKSKIPNLDFKIGSRLRFAAVLDQNSQHPTVWKALTAWTHVKPVPSYTISEWETAVSELYKKHEHSYHDLFNKHNNFSKTKTTLTIGQCKKVLKLEHDCIVYLLNDLKYDHGADRTYNLNDQDIDELMCNAPYFIKGYVDEQYKSIKDLIMCHSKVFNVSSDLTIHPWRVQSSTLDSYLGIQLPEWVCIWNSTQNLLKKSAFANNCSVDIFDRRSDNKFERLQLEQDSVYFLIWQFKLDNDKYRITDFGLNELLTEAPDTVKRHIKNNYPSVKEFLEFHSEVFTVTEHEEIFPCYNDNIVDAYLEFDLPRKFFNDTEDNSLTDSEKIKLKIKEDILSGPNLLNEANNISSCKKFVAVNSTKKFSTRDSHKSVASHRNEVNLLKPFKNLASEAEIDDLPNNVCSESTFLPNSCFNNPISLQHSFTMTEHGDDVAASDITDSDSLTSINDLSPIHTLPPKSCNNFIKTNTNIASKESPILLNSSFTNSVTESYCMVEDYAVDKDVMHNFTNLYSSDGDKVLTTCEAISKVNNISFHSKNASWGDILLPVHSWSTSSKIPNNLNKIVSSNSTTWEQNASVSDLYIWKDENLVLESFYAESHHNSRNDTESDEDAEDMDEIYISDEEDDTSVPMKWGDMICLFDDK